MCSEIEGDVLIHGNDITNLNGLSVIISIGGNLHIGGIIGTSNNSLISLQGLENLTTIGGSLEITNNSALITITGLNNLSSIGAGLMIHANNALENINGLNGLINVGGPISIGYCGGLTTIQELGSIDPASISDLAIYENGQLSECAIENICNYLTSPNGVVSIYNNSDGCQNPQEIANICGITLPCLPYGNYYFHTQEEIDGFQNNFPDCYDLEGDVTIYGYYIYNLMGLINVNSIGGSLYIHGGLINNILGLANLTSIGGNLTLFGNPCLVSFFGLSALSEIGGFLRIGINQNSALISLSGLENISEASITDLTIVGNYSLSECDIQNICAYLENPNGTVEIHGNANGCNSQLQVQQTCLTSIKDDKTQNAIFILPNPSNDKVTVITPGINEIIRIEIFNTNGKKVSERQLTETETQIDISALPRGVYFVRLQNEKMVEVGKMVKE